MNYLEAIYELDGVKANAKFALKYLQQHKGNDKKLFSALFVGANLYNHLDQYKEAVAYLIESDMAKLLSRHYNEVYEVTCKAEPLLKECTSKFHRMEEWQAKGSVWAVQIKVQLDKVDEWLQDNHPELIDTACSPTGGQLEASEKRDRQSQGEKPQHLKLEEVELEPDKKSKLLEILQEAEAKSLCSQNNGLWKWERTKALLAYFGAEISDRLQLGKGETSQGRKYVGWKPIEQVFGVKNLAQAQKDLQRTGNLPTGLETIENLLDKM